MRIFIQNVSILLLILVYSNDLQAQVSDFKNIDFTRADLVTKFYKDAPIDNLPVLAYKLTHKLPTKVEKFRAIYKWVCQNIKGDASQHNKVSARRKKFKNDSIALSRWNNEYKKIAFNKLMKHKKTMCTGYAYLIKELCFLAGIESVIIDGYGRTVDTNLKELEIANHSWNAVKIDKKWYLCDATWSSGYMVQNIFIPEYNDGYFLTDPILFGKNHFPTDKKWLLNAKATTDEFVNAPLIYGSAFEHDILPVSPQNMNVTLPKNDEMTFRFKTSQNISTKDIALVYYSANKERTFKIYNIKNENGMVSFTYKLKHRGVYDTHLKIDNDIVTTYTFKVTKNQTKIDFLAGK